MGKHNRKVPIIITPEVKRAIDILIKTRDEEMYIIGVCSPAEVRHHLRTFVQNELFQGKDLPHLNVAEITIQWLVTFETSYRHRRLVIEKRQMIRSICI